MNKSFEVVHRNPGHWDIYLKNGDVSSRIAKIRGGPYIFHLIVEKSGHFSDNLIDEFPSVESCMAYVCATLMKE